MSMNDNEIHIVLFDGVCNLCNSIVRFIINRDPKGLYQKSKSGLIKSMTGIDSKYETPTSFDIEISESNSLEESIETIYTFIKDKLVIVNE